MEFDVAASLMNPVTGQPLDYGSVPFDGKNPEELSAKIAQLRSRATTGVIVVSKQGVFERQPALASTGDGRSLLVLQPPRRCRKICRPLCASG
ncbi:MAG: hypothetical protein WHU94_11220 [Thermogemmata sp.]|nr:MAG: hypothetical protein KatS3mg106_630 [Gemmataceae bacterium]